MLVKCQFKPKLAKCCFYSSLHAYFNDLNPYYAN